MLSERLPISTERPTCGKRARSLRRSTCSYPIPAATAIASTTKAHSQRAIILGFRYIELRVSRQALRLPENDIYCYRQKFCSHWLFVAECDSRVDARSAPGRQVARGQRRGEQDCDSGRHSHWVVGFQAKEEGFDVMGRGAGSQIPNGEPGGGEREHFAQHHPDNAWTLRAKRHAYADLSSAARNRVRHRAVESDRGDEERK